MRHVRQLRLPFLLLAAFSFGVASASQQAKKPLDHSVYDGWRSLRGSAFTRDGKWLCFVIAPQVGDGEINVKSTDGPTEYKVPRGSLPRFSNDGKFLVCTILPAKADVDKAKKEKKAPKDMPKNALGVLDLTTAKLITVERLKGFKLADKDAGWLAYQVEDPPAATPAAGTTPPPAKAEVGQATPPAQQQPPKVGAQTPGQRAQEPPKEDKPQKKKDHAAGSELIVRNLATGVETKIADVADYVFPEGGKALVLSLSTKDGTGDGLISMDLSTGSKTTILSGMGRYQMLTLSKTGGRVAFVTDRDDYKAETPTYNLYSWSPGMKEAKVVAKEGSDGIPKGWVVPNRGSLRYSESGHRLIFPIAPKPEPEPKDKPAVPDDEKAELDVWNWKDSPLMSAQLLRAASERTKTYDAVIFLDSGRIVPLEDKEIDSAIIGSKGDGAFAIANSDQPYGVEASWNPGFNDIVLIEIASGRRQTLYKHVRASASLSPDSKYLTWWDGGQKAWFARDCRSGKVVNLTQDIPFPVHDYEDDHPDIPGPQGLGGWLEGDAAILIYDGFDVWQCDPSGSKKAVCVTDGYGRAWGIRLRITNTDPEKDSYSLNDMLLLNGFDPRSKAGGYLKDRLGSGDRPEKLIWGNYTFTFAIRAKEADRVLMTRQTFSECPNLWLTNTSFATPGQVSDVNPQQKDYNWATSELVEWTSLDGIPLQGLLIKPEDFDPAKKYPMMVYFYERDSDNLYRYRSPSPSASTINPTMFASNGYLVFIPDIPYKIGYPGESCVNAVLPGVTSLIQRPYVDAKHIGVQGQSWGGYQVAYLVTRTDIFAAAGAGAAVSDMFSAYGGIRWGSGLVRQMQYEHGQSRIGGTPWDSTLKYLENSPLFWADKIKTPMLLMNNDKDGAVPWYQGIELFTALRRLEQPVWMLVYNNEDHNLTQRKNQKDLSIRLQQFFDHYLKGAPAPVWMVEGVPATVKGKTYGLEIPGKGAQPPAKAGG